MPSEPPSRPPRRFAYYRRLSAADKETYRLSDAIPRIMMPDASALVPLVKAIEIALFSGKRARVAKAVTVFIDAFLAQIEAPAVKVHVREVRPDLDTAELHGLYTFGSKTSPPRLEVWMRTRANEQVVKHRTFMRTILHELLHHIDVTLFHMDDSFHTEGFFRRESSLVRQLLPAAPRPPKTVSEPRPPKPTQLGLFSPRGGRPSGTS